MRMWMVDPFLMCRQHLLGEHVELHMFASHINAGKSIDGYVRKNCVEPGSIDRRHTEVVNEMLRRGYRHNSPLEPLRVPLPHHDVKVDVVASYLELAYRCEECA